MDLDPSTPFRGSRAVRARDLTRGQLFGPRYRRVGADTYVTADAPVTPLADLDAALCHAGPDAVLTGWSACLALGLDVERSPQPIELAVPGRRLRSGDGVRYGRARIPDHETVECNGRRATTPLRTAFDLASRWGPDQLAVDARCAEPLGDAVVAADALARLGEFDGDDLLRFALRHRGARGVRLVARVADLLDARSDSPPETRLRVKLVLAGLPRPEVQYALVDELGRPRFWLDLAWSKYMVAAEYDGKDHAQADRRGRDIDRIDAIRREGWNVLVVTARQAARTRWVPDRIRLALRAGGWTG